MKPYRRSRPTTGVRRALALLAATLLALLAAVTLPSSAMAAPNPSIVVEDVVIGGGTGPGGQLILGDTVLIEGSWDASDADPHEGDTFTIGLPDEIKIQADVPFNLSGPDINGVDTVWATCLAAADSNQVVCTLTDAVEANPEFVHGDIQFEAEAVQTTKEAELEFDLNGELTPVELPGGGEIDDGHPDPAPWSKSGELADNAWSVHWRIDLPGDRLSGTDVLNIAEKLSDNHQLCDPPNLRVHAVRGPNSTEVPGIATIVPGADPQNFTIRLQEPAGGWDPDLTYRVTYDTCTPDGQIDPRGTIYENEATIDIWGESSGVIGVEQSWEWTGTITKRGWLLGGADRDGKLRWQVGISGNNAVGKDELTITDSLQGPHRACFPNPLEGARMLVQQGPSGELIEPIEQHFDLEDFSIDLDGKNFTVTVKIKDDSDFEFKPYPWIYGFEYYSCVELDDLPTAGTEFGNSAFVDGVGPTSKEVTVPDRTDQKSGRINSASVTLDGVQRLPQTTMTWSITVPGERLAGVVGDLVVTDTIAGSHQVCPAGNPTGGLKSQLGLKVEARDQVAGGGLATRDISNLVTAAQNGDDLTFTIQPPTLPMPNGRDDETGFSTEYQYVITYTTCTTSGGMDAPGTTYRNRAVVEGKTYERGVTQNNRGSGSGSGMPRGTVALSKNLADTPGADLVPTGTRFTVHVREIDPNGVTQVEYDLQVPLDGSPVSGFNSRGNGWTIELSEPTFPSVPGVTFGAPVFHPGPGVTVGPDGTTATAALVPGSNIAVSLTNTAQLGSAEVVKVLAGGAAGQVPADRTFDVTATIDTSALGSGVPAQPDRRLTLRAGQPVLLEDLPIGSRVTFSELRPADDDTFTWGQPVISPSPLLVTPGHANQPAQVTVTNTVERTTGTFSLIKLVAGEQAGNPAVPDSVTITATWDEAGTSRTKTLTLPTDGTPVPFDEDLLIGTVVTLTETPLPDGSSIAWGAPIWSGTGVQLDGRSAKVTITRDGTATVTLENHAATSTAGISLLKGVAGEAADEVGEDVEFPVTASWTDAGGVRQSKQLLVNATRPTPLGEDLPAGTVITLTEGDRPQIGSVDWGTIVITGNGVVDQGDGSATVIVSDQQSDVTLVTILNEANWKPGSFTLTKRVVGLAPDHPDAPASVTVRATWTDQDGREQSKELTVPTDGSVVAFGEDLPHNTEVLLSEIVPPDSPHFTWGTPGWAGDRIQVGDDGTAVLTIGAGTVAEVTLTNQADPVVGSLTLLKTLSGDGATSLPVGTTFPVTATWLDLTGEEQRVEFALRAGVPAVLADLPLGTEVTLTEGRPAVSNQVGWRGVTWSTSDPNVSIDGSGSTVVITVTGEAGTEVTITLNNEFKKNRILPITGGETLGMLTLAAVLIAAGVLLAFRRREA